MHAYVGAGSDSLFPYPPFPAPRQVLAAHLFHEGQFEVGQLVVEEAGVEGGEALKAPYAAMHSVLQEVRCAPLTASSRCLWALLQWLRLPTCLRPPSPVPFPPQIQRHNLGPVLAWVREHDAELAGAGGQPGAFEFSVHRLAFLTLLKEQGEEEEEEGKGGVCAFVRCAAGPSFSLFSKAWRPGYAGQQAAVAYARQHFGRFQATQVRAGCPRLWVVLWLPHEG